VKLLRSLATECANRVMTATRHATHDAESEQSDHDQPAPTGIRLVVIGCVSRVPEAGPEPTGEHAQGRHSADGARDGGDRVQCARPCPRQHCGASEDARRDDHGAADRAAPSFEAPGDCRAGGDRYENDDGQEKLVQRAPGSESPTP